MKLIGYAFALALLVSPAVAQEQFEPLPKLPPGFVWENGSIIGKALALDGDTLLVTQSDGSKVTVRLWGIDAPEMKDWPWGAWSRGVLDEFLEVVGNDVRCKRLGKSYERVVARCWHQTKKVNELSRVLITSGAAVEYRKFTGGEFSQDEAEARSLRRGIWGDNNWDAWALKMRPPRNEAERRQRLKILEELTKPQN